MLSLIKGRISRGEFGKKFTFPFILLIGLSFYADYYYKTVFRDSQNDNDLTMLIAGLAIFSCLFFCTVFFIRRLHDFDISSWNLVGYFVLFVLLLDYKPIPLFLLYILFFVIFLFYIKNGNKGTNRFGPNPDNPFQEDKEISSIKKLETTAEAASVVTKEFVKSKMSQVKNFAHTDLSFNYLTNKNWNLLNGSESNETIYIFRNNNQLLISVDGKIEKMEYEIIPENTSILFVSSEGSTIFNVKFLNNDLLVLCKYSSNYLEYFANSDSFPNLTKYQIIAEANKYL